MRRFIFLSALPFLVLAAPANAKRDSLEHRLTHKTRVLEAKNKRLHHRLRRAQHAHARLVKELATRTAERDAARRQVAALPPSLSVAVEQVRNEVAYAELYKPPVSRDALVAHAAMDYVTGHVSATEYGYITTFLGTQPAATAESVLDYGAGICGHAALTFAAFVKRLGVPVRSVQFYYADGVNTHIAVEAYYDGDWHFFDPTWGAYYEDGTDVLSITEARNRPGVSSLLHKNATLFWSAVQDMVGGTTDLPAELDQATRIELDKQPFVD